MRAQSQVRVLILLLILVCLSRASAQDGTPQSERWQGPRPAPQPRAPTLTPQPSGPAGRQVLEIPACSQHAAPDASPQQADIPPSQPRKVQPAQVITVTVTDQQGRYISGLTREDFIVYEDDVPQAILQCNTGQNEPVSLGLLVDTSGSMLNKIAAARRALRRFVQTIRPRDEVFLAAFNQRPLLVQDFTDSRALLVQATALLHPQGGTALYDAMLDGLHRVQQGRSQKKVLIVITDGLDGTSSASGAQVIDAIRRSGVVVYTIGVGNPTSMPRAGRARGLVGSPFPGGRRGGLFLGPPMMSGGSDTVDVRTLQEVSEETGGRFFLLNTADAVGSTAVLDEATQAISDELQQQYSLGYLSPLKGGVYRSVRVEVRRDGAKVRTHKGIG